MRQNSLYYHSVLLLAVMVCLVCLTHSTSFKGFVNAEISAHFDDGEQVIVNAEIGMTYTVNSSNSFLMNETNRWMSDLYYYENALSHFDFMVAYYEMNDNVKNFTFSVRKFGNLDGLLIFKFDGTVDKMFLRFFSLEGIFNIDMSKQLNVSIASDTKEHYLTLEGDEFGIFKRDCNELVIELNMTKTLSFSDDEQFYLVVKTNENPSPKEISLNEWTNVAYPSSYTLETGTEWKREITLKFPNQTPKCNAPYPQFILSKMDDVKTQDILDFRFKSDEIVILRSFMYYDANNLLKLYSSFNFWYQFTTMKDIHGNEVQIVLETMTCGSTFGIGYKYGTGITSISPKSNDYGELDCGESVYTNNSLIIIYAKIKKDTPPQPSIFPIFDGTSVNGGVTPDRQIYMLATIRYDTCVTFDGIVSTSPLSIYMLQQKTTELKNPILPTKALYNDMRIAPVGFNSIKFCTNETVFNRIGAVEQEMVFLFTTLSNDSSTEYAFSTTIQPYWKIDVIIGVSVGVAVAFLIILCGVIGFWRFTRKKKYAYDYIE